MELIPILSLIVLVATISTFILAVGAYVLYKIRERKGRVASAPAPAAIEAELVTPAQNVGAQREPTRQGTHTSLVTEQYQPQRITDSSIFQRGSRATQEDTRTFVPPMKQTFIGDSPETKYTREARYTVERPSRATKATAASTATAQTSEFSSGKKYMRYTADGYVEPDKDKQKKDKEDKLRWR